MHNKKKFKSVLLNLNIAYNKHLKQILTCGILDQELTCMLDGISTFPSGSSKHCWYPAGVLGLFPRLSALIDAS